MRPKKIDYLIIKAFLPTFFLTYCVVVFLLLIHLIMGYVEEFVGKDVGFVVFGKMLFYFAINLTPMSLPLAVLLSSLMCFGDLGEHFELTAIKSAGVSLVRTLVPVGVAAIFISGISFWFSNNLVPYANLKAYSTLYNVRQTKATLELKEGVFYNGIPGYSIKVGKKYPDGVSLKNLMIYTHHDIRGNREVIVSDSGRMYTILQGDYLVMELFKGNSYTEYGESGVNNNHPFVRNEYEKGKLVFSLSAFKSSDIPDSLFKYNRQMKNVLELQILIDSFQVHYQKKKKSTAIDALTYYLYHQKKKTQDTIFKPKPIAYTPQFVDSALKKPLDSAKTLTVLQRALNQARSMKGFLEYRQSEYKNERIKIVEHVVEYHKKFSFALTCFMMFLIGAPLGSIIKKGGLGIPILISVLFFILYYSLNTFFEKWAIEGLIDPILAMWLPTLIFMVFGLFFFIQARNDSRVFEVDVYKQFFRKITKTLKLTK